jgi:hypothetical protein
MALPREGRFKSNVSGWDAKSGRSRRQRSAAEAKIIRDRKWEK